MAKKLKLTNHTPEDISKLVSDKREELRALQFGAAGSKNRNVKAAKMIRRDIARALTEQTARQTK